jgi:polysaccharide biosynthesis/export protein
VRKKVTLNQVSPIKRLNFELETKNIVVKKHIFVLQIIKYQIIIFIMTHQHIKTVFRLSLILLIVLSGCIPQRQIMYLQDIGEYNKAYQNPFSETEQVTGKYMLRPNDYLYVSVRTLDPKISEFFNPMSNQSSNMSMQGGGVSTISYLIDDNMDIDFPYAGKINLTGCNLPMAQTRIAEALSPFLKEMNLTVRLASSTFTILGEVRSPGVKSMSKEQITIFDALAISGDFTIYGKRKKVKLMRQTNNGPEIFVFDVTDKNIINSQHYYVYPNDVIYVKPMKAKIFGIGESLTLGVFATLIGSYLTVSALTQ